MDHLGRVLALGAGRLLNARVPMGEFAIELLPEQQPHLDRARPPRLRLEFVPPG